MAGQDQASARARWRRLAFLIAAPLTLVAIWAIDALLSRTPMTGFAVLVPIGPLIATTVGAVILWRRPGHHMGRLLVAVGLMFAASAGIGTLTTAVDPAGIRFPRITPALVVAGEALGSLALLIASVSVIVRFPTGRRTSRLGLVVELLFVVVLVLQLLAEAVPALVPVVEGVASFGAFGTFPLAAVDIALRYRRAAPIERAQFRWLIAAATATGVLVIVMILFGSQYEDLWTIWVASTFLPTVAVGFAVLRYRLYDIDRIISRTIAYGALSLVLFAIFFVTNVLLQRAISEFVDGNVIATVASTLLVATLFQPVRRQAQRVMDRRFHRARYDAEQTVDAFAARLRHSVDLPRLVGDLRRTAGEAVEPSASVVWLRESAR